MIQTSTEFQQNYQIVDPISTRYIRFATEYLIQIFGTKQRLHYLPNLFCPTKYLTIRFEPLKNPQEIYLIYPLLTINIFSVFVLASYTCQ